MKLKDNKGYIALTSVLILSAFFVIVSIAAFSGSITQIDISFSSIASREVDYLNNSCTEYLIEKAKKDSSFTQGTVELTFEEGTCKGELISAGEFGSIILSQAEARGFQRKTRTDISQFVPETIITSFSRYHNDYFIKVEDTKIDWESGELDNTIYATEQGDLRLPEFGKALEFDGSNYVNCGDVLQLGTSSRTYSAYVKIGTKQTNATVLSKSENGAVAYRHALILTNTATSIWALIRADNNIDYSIEVAYSFDVGVWYHIVWRIDRSGNSEIFVNNVSIGTRDISAIATQDFQLARPFFLGAYSNTANLPFTNYSFNGKIDEVGIWNRALSSEEIQEMMYTELTGNEPGLVGYWKLNEGQGSVANDSSVFASHGTLVNNPTWVDSIKQGQRISDIIDLSSVSSVVSSKIDWKETFKEDPSLFTLTIETSLDGGDWQEVEKGDSIPGINKGDDLDGKELRIRQTLETANPSFSPILHTVKIEILGRKRD